jgi:hypothetical protein
VLLSTGMGSDPASFAATSDSGDDAFIVTRQRLVKTDRDSLVDVYDARVGGGFPEPPAPEPGCPEEGCLVPPPPTPQTPTTTAPGSGNLAAPKPCPRGKVRRGGRCVLKPCPKGKVRRKGKCISRHKLRTQRRQAAERSAAR